MKLLMRVVLLVAIMGFFSSGSFSSDKNTAQQQTPDQNVQVINMTAKKYVFDPATVHVKKGTKVQLHVTMLDREHGLKINVYPDGGSTKGDPGLVFTSSQDCWAAGKGQTVTIEFVAQTPGSYPFKCCKFCGFGHMGMKGQIVVDE